MSPVFRRQPPSKHGGSPFHRICFIGNEKRFASLAFLPPKGGTQNGDSKQIMYLWRKMNEKQREDALEYRRLRRFPKHAPPHFDFEGEHQYLVTAACYEHAHIIGKSPDRMTDCEAEF